MHTTSGSHSVTLTELLRDPNRVLPWVNAGPVTVRRRGGEDFCLVQRRQWEVLSSAWLTVANAYEEILDTCECRQSRRRDDAAIPWLSFLETEEQEECLRDIVETLKVSLETGKLSTLADTLAEWRATALATWDERRNRARVGYRDDAPVPVEAE